jgi:hypothetical protein
MIVIIITPSHHPENEAKKMAFVLKCHREERDIVRTTPPELLM